MALDGEVEQDAGQGQQDEVARVEPGHEAALLAQAFPERFVLGLGVGYPHQAASVGREFGSPVGTLAGLTS